MPMQSLLFLELAFEPVVAEVIRLILLLTVGTSIALGILAAVTLVVHLVAAWREAHAGHAALRVLGVSGKAGTQELRMRRMDEAVSARVERHR